MQVVTTRASVTQTNAVTECDSVGQSKTKHETEMVPQPPAPKPFNFREFVEVDEIARNPDYISPQKVAQDMANAKALAKAMLKYDAMMKKKARRNHHQPMRV